MGTTKYTCESKSGPPTKSASYLLRLIEVMFRNGFLLYIVDDAPLPRTYNEVSQLPIYPVLPHNPGEMKFGPTNDR